MLLDNRGVTLSRDELRVLINSINSKTVTEISKKTGLKKAYVLKFLREFRKVGGILFMPDFKKMGLHYGLVFLKEEGNRCREYNKAFSQLPHVIEEIELLETESGSVYMVLADRKTLPDLLSSDFSECFDFYDLELFEGWSTVHIRSVIEKMKPQEKIEVEKLAKDTLKNVQKKAKTKEDLRKMFEESRRIELQELPKTRVFYIDVDEYDVKILDFKVKDAYASISMIADEYRLYRQMLHYHYVNHVIPLWRGNIIIWKSVVPGASYQLFHYRGADVGIAKEYFRVLPTTMMVTMSRDNLFVFTSMNRDMVREVKSFLEKYGLDIIEAGYWPVRYKRTNKRPFSSIYAEKGWIPIYDSFKESLV